eukprot:6351304-Pyramimonas_sp.AAC.1
MLDPMGPPEMRSINMLPDPLSHLKHHIAQEFGHITYHGGLLLNNMLWPFPSSGKRGRSNAQA